MCLWIWNKNTTVNSFYYLKHVWGVLLSFKQLFVVDRTDTAGPLIGQQQLTSSCLPMYLGRYFDRHYQCEKKDNLFWGSPWRRCVRPLACADFHQHLPFLPRYSGLLELSIIGHVRDESWDVGMCYWVLQSVLSNLQFTKLFEQIKFLNGPIQDLVFFYYTQHLCSKL